MAGLKFARPCVICGVQVIGCAGLKFCSDCKRARTLKNQRESEKRKRDAALASARPVANGL